MTSNEARTLNVGDRVKWSGDQADLGTVTNTEYGDAIHIKWDNDLEGFIHVNDFINVTRVRK